MIARTKVHVASSRPIGHRCGVWIQQQNFANIGLVHDPSDCEVFISVMYDKLVPEAFINDVMHRRRCYNFHPGLLPGYRGAGAFSWAIINGEERTGVTLHVIDKDMDSGPIIQRQELWLRDTSTAGGVFDQAMELMFEMFTTWFQRLATGDVIAVPQTESQARIYPRASLKGQADLTRFVRAFTFPGKDKAFYVNSKGEKIELEW